MEPTWFGLLWICILWWSAKPSVGPQAQAKISLFHPGSPSHEIYWNSLSSKSLFPHLVSPHHWEWLADRLKSFFPRRTSQWEKHQIQYFNTESANFYKVAFNKEKGLSCSPNQLLNIVTAFSFVTSCCLLHKFKRLTTREKPLYGAKIDSWSANSNTYLTRRFY